MTRKTREKKPKKPELKKMGGMENADSLRADLETEPLGIQVRPVLWLGQHISCFFSCSR